jgi:RNA polymerase sigma-70 factor (ECF subfamily)
VVGCLRGREVLCWCGSVHIISIFIFVNQAVNDTKIPFEELFKQQQQALKSFLYRLTTSKEDAEDLAQETFIKAFRNKDSFKGESSFKTWLFAIASNLAKDHFRAQKRWPADAQDQCKSMIGSSQELAAGLKEFNQEAEYGRYEIREHIDFCFTCIMKTLPLEQHITLMLADIYSFRIKEIAAIMEVTEGVVKHYLHNARTSMQKVFEHRCALINKEGACHQCSELNGFNNTKAETRRIIAETELAKAAADPDRQNLFAIRTQLVKAIDPFIENGFSFHDLLLRHTNRALEKSRSFF